MNDIIQLLVPSMPKSSELQPYLQRIDESRWYSNFGPLSRELEMRWLGTVGETNDLLAISVANGCIGLELTLSALGLPTGARVLLPSFTFAATGTAVLRAGLIPVFADVCPDRWILTPQIALDALAKHAIDAVMPVATFGHPQNVEQWTKFSQDTGLPVLIDAAGAFGNQRAAAGCHVLYSLHATKSLGAGEGGILVTADRYLAERVRRLSNFGINISNSEIEHAGTNGKLSEYHAAVALASLDTWPDRYEKWRQLMHDYRVAMAELPVRQQSFDKDWVSPIFPIALASSVLRDRVMKKMAAEGIETRRWYCPPLHRQPVFANGVQYSFPITDSLADTLLGIPFHLFLTSEKMRRLFSILSVQLNGVK